MVNTGARFLMVTPSKPAAPVGESEHERPPRYRHPEQLTPEQQQELLRVRTVDAEAYLEWLETGEGSEPRGESSG
jgi:hypothetical protein